MATTTDRSNTSIALTISEDLRERLARLADDQGLSLQECLILAVEEFVASREDFAACLARLEGEFDNRPCLESVVKQDERAALLTGTNG